MEGYGYVFRAILASRYPLEAHLSRAVGHRGAEPQLKLVCALRKTCPPSLPQPSQVIHVIRGTGNFWISASPGNAATAGGWVGWPKEVTNGSTTYHSRDSPASPRSILAGRDW